MPNFNILHSVFLHLQFVQNLLRANLPLTFHLNAMFVNLLSQLFLVEVHLFQILVMLHQLVIDFVFLVFKELSYTHAVLVKLIAQLQIVIVSLETDFKKLLLFFLIQGKVLFQLDQLDV